MFSVTVMMFRDIVESVMLLKDDDCNTTKHCEMPPAHCPLARDQPLTCLQIFSSLPTVPGFPAVPCSTVPTASLCLAQEALQRQSRGCCIQHIPTSSRTREAFHPHGWGYAGLGSCLGLFPAGSQCLALVWADQAFCRAPAGRG